MADLKMYGLNWPNVTDPLMVERLFVKGKGYYTKGGKTYGHGLYHHMRQMMTYCWPEDDHHRWSDLGLKRICENEITVFLGSSDSNKTYLVSRFVLLDWWANSDNTLWLVSSTEMRGAELRIWGKLKELFNRARKLHPWLPGTVLDSKHAITTEEISEDGSEARLLTKGLIFIPCFPSGTLVDTPLGSRSIESIQVGEKVIGASGIQTVTGTSKRNAERLVRITLEDGRTIDCTADHPILTGDGWCDAIYILPKDIVLSVYDTLQILWENVREIEEESELLLHELSKEGAAKEVSGVQEKVHSVRPESKMLFQELLREMELEGEPGISHGTDIESGLECCGEENEQLDNGEPKGTETKKRKDETALGWVVKKWNAAVQWLRSWASKDAIGIHSDRSIPRSEIQSLRCNWEGIKKGISPCLLFGSGVAGNKIGRGDKWSLSQWPCSVYKGFKKNIILGGTRVDRVEVLKQGSDPRYDASKGGYTVHNLEVGTHPSYSVNGVIVHNCKTNNRWLGMGAYAGIKPTRGGRLGHCGDEVSFMERSFLDAYSNWYGKENFKGLLTGNPTDIEDPLCTAAEPVDGWDNWHDTEKTQEWRTKFYGAWAVAFDGRDSPNFDFPANEPTKFPYLIGRKKLEAVEKTEGKESPLWWMMCVGKPLPGSSTMKVITRQMCEQNKAYEDVVWEGNKTTHVLGLDAAYGGIGGDRCVLFHSEFGIDVEGKSIFACRPPILVPVSVKNAELAETQIARFCMQYADGMGISADNFFFDARATLAVELARIWSPQVNAVDFGGTATKRPVSMDEYVWEGDTQTKRLKRCDEHYSKFVTELWFSIRYAVMSHQVRRLPRDVAAEGAKRLWRFTKGQPPRIEVESKIEMKERTKESPDLFDSLATTMEGARRLGFVIENMKEPRSENQAEEDWLNNAVDKHKRFMRSHELSYNL
jgi:hypothetical protein